MQTKGDSWMAGEVEFKGKGQALRLGIQQELGGGPLTIFGAAAQKHGREHMFQIASLYCKAHPWEAKEMADRMLDVARTSLRILAADLDFGANQA